MKLVIDMKDIEYREESIHIFWRAGYAIWKQKIMPTKYKRVQMTVRTFEVVLNSHFEYSKVLPTNMA